MTLAGVLTEKNPGLLLELDHADPRLKVLVLYAAAVSLDLFGVPAVLTRVNGTRAQTIQFHGSGSGISPHEVRPCRAADLRTRGLLDDTQAELWQNTINDHLEYSPAGAAKRFNVALYETQEKMLAKGRDPSLQPIVPHLHLQLPPWTGKGLAIIRLWSFGVGTA